MLGRIVPNAVQPERDVKTEREGDTMDDLQRMARAFLDQRQAMTAIIPISIAPHVMDAQVLAATGTAAELFGFSDSATMEGRLVSTLHHIDDVRIARVRHILRTLGIMPSKDRYSARIVRPDGQQVRVEKSIEQHKAGETLITITTHRELDLDTPHTPLELPHLPEVSCDVLQAITAQLSMAEITGLVRHYPVITGLIPTDADGTSHASMVPIPQGLASRTPVSPLILQGALKPHYVCHCLVCRREWVVTGHTLPKRCAYTDCRGLFLARCPCGGPYTA